MSDIVKAAANAGALAAFDYGTDAGAGYEKVTADDLSIPFLNVLQALSPEVAGEPGDRVAGATAGRLMNTVTKELYPEAGVIFQPCSSQHMFVEWKPRTQGGGFVGVHDQNDPMIVAAKAASKDFGKYKSPAGNDLVETIYLAGLIHRTSDVVEQAKMGPGEPIIITFQSTKIKAIKNLNYRLYTFILPNGQKPPLFAHRVLIQTFMDKNNKGVFYNYKLTGLVNDNLSESLLPPSIDGVANPLLVAGKAFKKASDSGSLKVNYAKTNGADTGGAGGAAGGDDDVPF